jgi:hypothetical protein
MRSALVLAVLLGAAVPGVAELTHVLIQKNREYDEGGGLENSGAVVMLTDCRIIGNKARTDGGGLVNEDRGTMSLTGCVVAGNRAKVGGSIDAADVVLGPEQHERRKHDDRGEPPRRLQRPADVARRKRRELPVLGEFELPMLRRPELYAAAPLGAAPDVSVMSRSHTLRRTTRSSAPPRGRSGHVGASRRARATSGRRRPAAAPSASRRDACPTRRTMQQRSMDRGPSRRGSAS